MAWWDDVDFQLDPTRITIRELLDAADADILGPVLAMAGLGAGAVDAAKLRASAYVAWMCARQQRPATTLDEVYDLPAVLLNRPPVES